jgi:hypothetical protein
MIAYEAPTRIDPDNQAINNLIDAKPFLLKQLLVSEQFLFDNCEIIPYRSKYDKRPDLVAYEYYGIMAYYPVILFSNNIGSLFQFNQDNLNNRILVPNIDFVQKYLI